MSATNGVAVDSMGPPGLTGSAMMTGRLKSRSDRQPILSLVDREYLKSTANLPRGVWEPMSYLYSEGDQSLARIKAMEVPAALEWAREAAITKWHQAIGWLDELLVTSQSVDALRSWQLMTGMQNNGQSQPRPSAAIMPDFPQPQPPKPQGGKPNRGLRL